MDLLGEREVGTQSDALLGELLERWRGGGDTVVCVLQPDLDDTAEGLSRNDATAGQSSI